MLAQQPEDNEAEEVSEEDEEAGDGIQPLEMLHGDGENEEEEGGTEQAHGCLLDEYEPCRQFVCAGFRI